ncbi:CocE/NonD family hydrolase [Blastococcus sp. SYSU D00922]
MMTTTAAPGRRSARALSLALPVVVAVTVASPATAAPKDANPGRGHGQQAAARASAFDYTQVEGLSTDRYGTVKETLELPMHDGTEVHVEVTRPAGADGAPEAGEFPVILEASPYHGAMADREGMRILPEPRDEDGTSLGLTGYFVPKGYVVVMMDLRGTGLSDGCLDHLGPKDAQDLEDVVEWAAAQPWSNGRVGMTGHSYVGSTPSLAAAMDPQGLETIVPSAGMATMYDHQFQAGVPYFLQWAGPMYAYEQIALERDLPGGEHAGDKPEQTGCGLPNSALTAGEAQLSGQYTAWHGERDWRAGATAADIPVFMVHGVNDNAARVAGMDWFTQRAGRAGDKLWLGQWDHGSGCCPTRRGIQWTYALHAWFDLHLAQRDVDTGPAVELFLSDGTFEGGRTGDRTQVMTATQWPPAAETLTLHPSADGTLDRQPSALPGSVSFTGDPLGHTDPQGTGGADFVSEPVAQDTVLAGKPLMDLVASVTVPRVHLIGTLYDESPDGERRRISQFAINPELRVGVATPKPVIPGQLMEMQPPGFAMAHDLRAGHRLALRFTTSDPDKVPTFAVDPRVTIATGPGGTVLRVPVVTSPALADDTVPFGSEDGEPAVGPAQPGGTASVTPALGAPERTPVTVAFHEFDVREGFDNAALLVGAVPASAADVDLYLQRLQPDGSWSGDLTSGGSSSLTEESLRMTDPAPGRYRLEVHNWAGAPSTRIDLTLTFLNSVGEPG